MQLQVSLPSWVRWCVCTYRAVIDSLVNISKLTLSYAATQLYPVPLDLIIPRWQWQSEQRRVMNEKNK